MENSLRAKELVEGSKEEQQARFCGIEKSPAVVIKHRESDEQRDNLFHSRCFVDEKLVSLVIDGGSCANLVIFDAVKKLGLTTQKHPQPYSLSWINEHGTLNVTKRALVRFKLGSYEDEVVCDVVPKHKAHVLLGRPWKFDRRVIHDGWENSYTFKHEGKKIKLKPMSPDAVFADLKHMEENRNEGKSVQAQLWVQRRVGFNFMSFRKPQKEEFSSESTSHNNPCSARKELCFAPVKSNLEKADELEELKEGSSQLESEKVFFEGIGLSTSGVGASGIPEFARIEPLMNTSPSCPTSKKQNSDQALVGKPAGEASTCKNGTESYEKTPELLKTRSIELKLPALEDYASEISPLFSSNGVEEGSLLGNTMAHELTPTDIAESLKSAPKRFNVDRFKPKRPE
ncbi:unnamed protein product [Linum trigynum]|uniref:Uncharacterized protein n=1 Tax=Linum trigynum TaxID=586398 RepID=A0AAV2G9N6_9ROSI